MITTLPSMRARIAAVAVAISLAVGSAGAAETLPIGWSDLRADISGEPSVSGDEAEPGKHLAQNLRGRAVEISGYMLPVDREGDLVYEFMLVPAKGSCSHRVPAANQVVHVFPKEPWRARGIYEPVSVTGHLRLGLSQTQFFVLDGVAVVESGYRVGQAKIARLAEGPDAPPATGGRNPWKRLQRQ